MNKVNKSKLKDLNAGLKDEPRSKHELARLKKAGLKLSK